MKNNLSDLGDHLFMMVERLGDEDMSSEELDREIGRARAMCDVAGQIISVASTQLKALNLAEEMGLRNAEMPALVAMKGGRDSESGKLRLEAK